MKISPQNNAHGSQYPLHRLSLLQIFQRYCMNPQQLYILSIHGSVVGLIQYEHVNNYGRSGYGSSIKNGNNYGRHGSGLFANTISKMGMQNRSDIENNNSGGGYVNGSYSKYRNNGSNVKNRDRDRDRSDYGSKSPLRKRNTNTNTNTNQQSNNYYNNVCYGLKEFNTNTNTNTNYSNGYCNKDSNGSEQVMIDSNKHNYINTNTNTNTKPNIINNTHYHLDKPQNNIISDTGQIQKSSPVVVGSNAYKIINKTYNNNNNKDKIQHQHKQSINNNVYSKSSQHQVEFSLSSFNSLNNNNISNANHNGFKMQSQVIAPENLVQLSFQNLDYFAENQSMEPRIGEVLPPVHTMKSFGRDLVQKQGQPKEEKQKNEDGIQKIIIEQKKQSKISIEISSSDPSEGQKKQEQKSIKKSLIQSLIGVNSSRKKVEPQGQNDHPKQPLQYRTPSLHESLKKEKNDQNQNNPESNKKPLHPQNQMKFDEHVKNPYAQTHKQSQHQLADKYRKLSDEQVVQIISSRKKSVLQKKQQKSNISNLQMKNQNKMLDMSDLDIDALLKIRKIESVVKSDNRESQLRVGNINIVSKMQVDKQIQMKNGDMINIEQKLESNVRYFIRHPEENKNIQQGNVQKLAIKQAQNLVTPNTLLSPSYLNTSFTPHYRLYPSSSSSSPRNQDNMGTSRSNLFVPSNINATKPTQSRVYEVRRLSQQSQAQSSIVFQLSANSNF